MQQGTEAAERPSAGFRVCVVASPRLFADSMARTVALAGWPVDLVCAEPSDLAQLDRVLTDGHLVIIADGALPASALAAELRRRRAGQRVIVIGGPAPVGEEGVSHLSSTAGVLDLIRQLERTTGSGSADRQLTSRHVEILQLVAQGCTTDEVGERLGIASKTVNNHLSAVYRRLRTRNLTQAVLHAARSGLIDVSAV